MESRNTSKMLNNCTKSKRVVLSEVSNTQKSKGSEIIKRWLQHDSRDSDSSKEVVNSSMVTEENEKDSSTQETVIFNGIREINIPTPRKVASPTKVTWYYSPRVVIPIVTPPEVTVNKPNFEIMKSSESSITTIKKPLKKPKSNLKKSQPNNNNSLLNWFGPSASSNGGNDKPNPTLNEIRNSNVFKEINNNSSNVQSESRLIANIKKRPQKPDESNTHVTPLPSFENVDLGTIDMNFITEIIKLYDFMIKFEKPLNLDLEEMILDDHLHTRLAFLQCDLLSFLYKESEEECDIDFVNLQYHLAERYPNVKFLREKEHSEFSPRERISIFNELINEALHTNRLHEFIKELSTQSNHKKENVNRSERIKEIKFKINEIRVKIINKENEIKDVEKQIKEQTASFESQNNKLDLPNAVSAVT